MLKLTKLIVKNFKNIENADLELTNFNLIVGPNNSGKSNFLQVFPVLDFIISKDKSHVEKAFKNGIFDSITRITPDHLVNNTHEISFNLEFELQDEKIIYELVITSNNNRDFTPNYQITKELFTFKYKNNKGPAIIIISRQNDNRIKIGNEFKKELTSQIVEPHTSGIRYLDLFPLERIKKYVEALKSIIKSPILYFSNQKKDKNTNKNIIVDKTGRINDFDYQSDIIEILESDKRYQLIKIFNKFFKNFDLDVIKIPDFEKENIMDFKKIPIVRRNNVHVLRSLEDLSDGSIYLIKIILKILLNEQAIVMIEEPENSVHPKALIDLYDFIVSYSSERQFIIVSHSLVLLNKTKPENVITSCIHENGLSKITNVANDKELRKKLRKGYVSFSDYIFFDEKLEDEEEFIEI